MGKQFPHTPVIQHKIAESSFIQVQTKSEETNHKLSGELVQWLLYSLL